jgi:hypothetical protein
MMVSTRFQRLGDMAAGTLVIYRAPPSQRSVADSTAQVTPPPIALSLDEQRAILDFAERLGALNAERAAELAAIPAPALGQPQDPVAALGAMAAWLRGGGSSPPPGGPPRPPSEAAAPGS